MTITKNLKIESVWLLLSTVILKVIQFITIIILARFLKASEFGIFGLTFAVSEIITVLSNFGIGTYLIYKDNLNDNIISSAF